MKLPPLFNFRGTPRFTTDGCSGYMSWAWLKLFGHKPPWDGVCVMHDWIYWAGGTGACIGLQHIHNRRDADAFLFREIKRKGFHFWAWVCWLATRVGGSQYLPFSWRWRYRERYLAVLDPEHDGALAYVLGRLCANAVATAVMTWVLWTYWRWLHG